MESAHSIKTPGEVTISPQPQFCDLDTLFSGCNTEMPPLDFDFSTASSSLASTNPSGMGPDELKLNPEAPCFPYNDPSSDSWNAAADLMQVNYGGAGLPAFNHTSWYCGCASNEDMKCMLMKMASKLDAIEAAVGETNARLSRMEGLFDSIWKEPPGTDIILEAIDGLKISVKEFSKALLTQLLGSVDAAEDVE